MRRIKTVVACIASAVAIAGHSTGIHAAPLNLGPQADSALASLYTQLAKGTLDSEQLYAMLRDAGLIISNRLCSGDARHPTPDACLPAPCPVLEPPQEGLRCVAPRSPEGNRGDLRAISPYPPVRLGEIGAAGNAYQFSVLEKKF